VPYRTRIFILSLNRIVTQPENFHNNYPRVLGVPKNPLPHSLQLTDYACPKSLQLCRPQTVVCGHGGVHLVATAQYERASKLPACTIELRKVVTQSSSAVHSHRELAKALVLQASAVTPTGEYEVYCDGVGIFLDKVDGVSASGKPVLFYKVPFPPGTVGYLIGQGRWNEAFVLPEGCVPDGKCETVAYGKIWIDRWDAEDTESFSMS
jgi:hypothetical protein